MKGARKVVLGRRFLKVINGVRSPLWFKRVGLNLLEVWSLSGSGSGPKERHNS